MQDSLLPLFPLRAVLLPHTPLPLHIFEERYKEMIGDVTRDKIEFGVVQAAEQGLVNTGCTASVERVLKSYPDGRMDILTIGRRRFEIVSLNDDKAYLRGSVEYFEDEDEEDAPIELQRKAIESFEALKAAEETLVFGEPKLGDPLLSFQLAQLISDLDFRQRILNTRSETERMKQLLEFAPGYATKLKHIAHVKEVAPKNGHSNGTVKF